MSKLSPFSWRRNTPAERPGRDPFHSLHDEVDRLFSDFSKHFSLPALGLQREFTAPSIDVSETDNEIKIEADLPGLEDKDVEVILSDNVLTIRGEKKSEREDKRKEYHVVERSSGSFSRSVPLPFEADPDAINATFAKGVLSIILPKPPQTKERTKRIDIKSGS